MCSVRNLSAVHTVDSPESEASITDINIAQFIDNIGWQGGSIDRVSDSTFHDLSLKNLMSLSESEMLC